MTARLESLEALFGWLEPFCRHVGQSLCASNPEYFLLGFQAAIKIEVTCAAQELYEFTVFLCLFRSLKQGFGAGVPRPLAEPVIFQSAKYTKLGPTASVPPTCRLPVGRPVAFLLPCTVRC